MPYITVTIQGLSGSASSRFGGRIESTEDVVLAHNHFVVSSQHSDIGPQKKRDEC